MSLSFGRNRTMIASARMLARELRKEQTPAEKMFWDAVRDNKFHELKFYRQHPIFFNYNGKERFFIADFYCHSKRIVIELDGAIHKRQVEYDSLRTFIINTLGIRVLRFKNDEIERGLANVLGKISDFIKQHALAPLPLRREGGGG
jgi:very-short-patch-repair endonuclease